MSVSQSVSLHFREIDKKEGRKKGRKEEKKERTEDRKEERKEGDDQKKE